jgi:hypothetical protein
MNRRSSIASNKTAGTMVSLVCLLLSATILASFPGSQQSQTETFTPLTELPVATQGNAIGDLLRKWFAKGTAAGNAGDFYDNRDGGHSLLNMAPYPQLQKIEYSEDQIKSRQNWAMQTQVLPFVVFGNSSTAAPPELGGSNTRRYYNDPKGIAFLFAQYARNNLYIYPSHHDHDPGHNGVGGYGDMFPTNTPYLITSQGSSGTDQPFMQALPYVLAAFQPEVKKKLVQSGMLMPTIQMILRITGKQIAGAREYLTGKAHPTVFQGADVDAQAMVELAHGITPSNIPPIALIRTIREDTQVNDVDYFDPGRTEKLADTPAVIARVFRGAGFQRKILVSAEGSTDLNKRPLKYYWEVLRGDPGRIKIEYLNPAHSSAAITISYFERSPIASDSGLESNRVDIGVFVHNGAYYSPPAFITFYTLDNEARTYGSDGRPIEIAYGAGATRVWVADWNAFFEALESRSGSWPCSLLRKQFKAEEIAGLRKAAEAFHKAHAVLLAAQEMQERAKAESKPAGIDAKAFQAKQAAAAEEIRKLVQDAKQGEAQCLEKKMKPMNFSAADLAQKALNSMLKDPNLWSANITEVERVYGSAGKEARQELDQVKEKFAAFGMADKSAGAPFRVRLLNGDNSTAELTRCEKGMIERLNAVILSRLAFPGIVNSDWRANFVDYDIASAKEWRDVYRYAPDGTSLGWRRYQSGGILEFNAEGFLVTNRDSRDRCIRARGVKYYLDRDPNGRIVRVKFAPTDTIREYEYQGAHDWKGFIKSK